ncbi:hypothetical protein GCM10023096_40500 [Nonomuraea ferruginea]
MLTAAQGLLGSVGPCPARLTAPVGTAAMAPRSASTVPLRLWRPIRRAGRSGAEGHGKGMGKAWERHGGQGHGGVRPPDGMRRGRGTRKVRNSDQAGGRCGGRGRVRASGESGPSEFPRWLRRPETSGWRCWWGRFGLRRADPGPPAGLGVRISVGSALLDLGQALLRVADDLRAGAVRAVRGGRAHQRGRPDLGLPAAEAAAAAPCAGRIDHGMADPREPVRSAQEPAAGDDDATDAHLGGEAGKVGDARRDARGVLGDVVDVDLHAQGAA